MLSVDFEFRKKSFVEGRTSLLPDIKIRGWHMRWEYRERFPSHRPKRKPLTSDPGIHHGTCVTWCMSGSLTRDGGETFPAFWCMRNPQFYVSGKKPMTLLFYCIMSWFQSQTLLNLQLQPSHKTKSPHHVWIVYSKWYPHHWLCILIIWQ